MTFAFHPYANLFPLIEGQEFYDLAEDIRINGLHDRIDLIEIDGGFQILDGRNRYRALVWIMTNGERLGAGWRDLAGEPLAVECLSDFDGDRFYLIHLPEADGDSLAYVLSKNLKRRQLDESQRAMVAARIANLTHGGNRSKAPIGALSDEAAAETLNVGERSVERAKAVQRSAVAEIVEAVDRGHLAVSAAAEIAAQPVERQAEIVAHLPRDETGKLTAEAKKALAPVIKEIRAEKVAAKKDKRAEREQQHGQRLQQLPAKSFGVAIEDFEWDHEPWSRETGLDRHPSNHYETAADAHTPEQIVARCAERFACLADDCILFKWSTIPHLAIALKVMELQGFRYVSQRVWNKERPGAARGPGYWVTGEHEIVLIGVRGHVVPPATAHFRSNFSAPAGEHSAKPDDIHAMIEFHWPNTPKVEFNARRARPGWTPWGFDVPATSAEPMPSGSALGASDGSLPPRTTPSREIAAAHPLDIPEFLRRTPRRAEPPVSEPVIKARLGQ
jgi:N6-adenosine-specific RNA methylase IME4/urease accessory protein UreF